MGHVRPESPVTIDRKRRSPSTEYAHNAELHVARAPAGLRRAGLRSLPHDAASGPALRALRQLRLLPQRHAVGGTVQGEPSGHGNLLPALQPLHRVQPGTGTHGGAPWGLPLVELPISCRRCSGQVALEPRAIRASGARCGASGNRRTGSYSVPNSIRASSPRFEIPSTVAGHWAASGSRTKSSKR